MAEQFARRRLTDRKDGRRLRTVSPIFQLSPFTMIDPSDAICSFTDSVDTHALKAWLHARRDVGDDVTDLLDVVVAAWVRTLSQYPAMDRFVSGRFIYARNTIDIVLPATGPDAGGMSVTVRFLPTDTVFDVSRKIGAREEDLMADRSIDRLERLAATLVKTPRFILRTAVRVMRWLDYHGWLSKGLTEKSPFHGSAVIYDDGAFRAPAIQRSLNRLGGMAVSLSIGQFRTVTEIDEEKRELVDRHYLDLAVSYDSRIADTAYVSRSYRYFRHLLTAPEELESPPNRVVTDTV